MSLGSGRGVPFWSTIKTPALHRHPQPQQLPGDRDGDVQQAANLQNPDTTAEMKIANPLINPFRCVEATSHGWNGLGGVCCYFARPDIVSIRVA